jgi:hypothetical protein
MSDDGFGATSAADLEHVRLRRKRQAPKMIDWRVIFPASRCSIAWHRPAMVDADRPGCDHVAVRLASRRSIEGPGHSLDR